MELEVVSRGPALKALRPRRRHGDYEVFDEPDLHAAFRRMADEACKWNWRATKRAIFKCVPDEMLAGDENFDPNPRWRLGVKLEPYQRSFTSEKDRRERPAVMTEADCESDGSYVEVWLRSPMRIAPAAFRWGEMLILAQFGDREVLHVSCVGHPLVETSTFTFLNSDGSSQMELDPQYLTHPLQVIAYAEMFCVQQTH